MFECIWMYLCQTHAIPFLYWKQITTLVLAQSNLHREINITTLVMAAKQFSSLHETARSKSPIKITARIEQLRCNVLRYGEALSCSTVFDYFLSSSNSLWVKRFLQALIVFLLLQLFDPLIVIVDSSINNVRRSCFPRSSYDLKPLGSLALAVPQPFSFLYLKWINVYVGICIKGLQQAAR